MLVTVLAMPLIVRNRPRVRTNERVCRSISSMGQSRSMSRADRLEGATQGLVWEVIMSWTGRICAAMSGMKGTTVAAAP